MPVPALPDVFGRYRVIRLLGQGAMGAVYLAEDSQLGRQVALKIPTFDGENAEGLARFRREARTAATLRHANICPVYDVGEVNGCHFISMAFLDGQPLSHVIKNNPALGEKPALVLVRKLALALVEAHQQGIVHRDLKPANVMIDSKREPIVMDFGLACQIRNDDARLTQDGVVVGSPAYMAPEQMEGDFTKLTPAVDQYSLGVILFELLTGQLPYRGSVSAVISQVTTKPTPAISSLRSEIDPRIDALCLRMMAKSAEERFPSLKGVADEITRILTPVSKPGGKVTAASAQGSQHSTETVVSERERWSTELPTLLALAKDLYRKHDYAETRKVLAKIPAGVRTAEIEKLLSEAADKDDECCLLLSDIEQSLQQQTPTDLRPQLKRFLQLKPGHKGMQRLARDINQYGLEQAFKIRRRENHFEDPAGRTVQPKHIALVAGGLFTLCAAVYFAASAYEAPHGRVIVNVADPKIVVMFVNEKVTEIESGREFTLRPEQPEELRIDLHGVSITEATRTISVEKNETKTITARLEPDGSLKVDIADTKHTFVVNAEKIQQARQPTVDTATDIQVRSPAKPAAMPPLVENSATVATTTTPSAPEKPSRKIFFVDDYDKRQPYWSDTTPVQLKENPNHQWGYRNGVYFDEVKSPSWYFGLVPGGPYPECTLEVSSRVLGDNPKSRGGVILQLMQPDRGIHVKLDGSGVIWIAPSFVGPDPYSGGPWVGPITHRAIRPGGGAYNKIRIDIHKRRLEVFVNDAQVVAPMEFAWDLTPVSFGLGIDCQTPSVRAEHDRIEIGEPLPPVKPESGSAPAAIKILANGAAVLPDGTHCYEGTSLKVASVTGGGITHQVDLQSFQGIWTNDCQLLWWGGKINNVLTLDIPIEASGLYQIVPGFTLGPDFGRFKMTLDGEPLFGGKPIDLFDPRVQPATPVPLGTLPLSPGTKKLVITAIGKNRSSTGFVLGLDELRLIPVR